MQNRFSAHGSTYWFAVKLLASLVTLLCLLSLKDLILSLLKNENFYKT